MDIIEEIKKRVDAGTVIPKPDATSDYVVKGWEERREEEALVYQIPDENGGDPLEKGIAVSEFRAVHNLISRGEAFTVSWFKANLPACSKEGSCNFTTIGGIFQMLGVAKSDEPDVYIPI